MTLPCPTIVDDSKPVLPVIALEAAQQSPTVVDDSALELPATALAAALPEPTLVDGATVELPSIPLEAVLQDQTVLDASVPLLPAIPLVVDLPGITLQVGMDGWSHRVKLTIDGTVAGISDSVDAPCMVAIPSALKAVCQANGEDLRITASNGETLLDYAIEDWSADNPIVHFRHTFGTGDTVVYAYGGNAEASDAQDKAAVAGGDCKLYLPLGDAGPTTAYDWSGNDNDGTADGDPTFAASAKIGKGVDFDGDDCLVLPNYVAHSQNNSLSISAWIKTGQSSPKAVVVGGNRYSYVQPFGGILVNETSKKASFSLGYAGGAYRLATGGPDIDDDQWHHLAGYCNSDGYAIYVDGSLGQAKSDYGTDDLDYDSENWRIACLKKGADHIDYFTGLIDQVIVRQATWTADEIAFAANAYPGSPMFSWGAVEIAGAVTGPYHVPLRHVHVAGAGQSHVHVAGGRLSHVHVAGGELSFVSPGGSN